VYGQELALEGVVIDSITRQPIPFVAIAAKGRKTSTISNEEGRFSYSCFFGDTIVFLRLGYERKSILARNNGQIKVLLKEVPKLLESVTIYGSYKPQGSEQWKMAVELPYFQNPGARTTNDYMQTIGVGASIGVEFDYFSKEKREKRKLARVQEELDKTRVFREVVENPETKRYLINLFKLTDTEYHQKLAAFNQQMSEAQQAKTKKEVLDLLVSFFALK
jgi:hypothetical protein